MQGLRQESTLTDVFQLRFNGFDKYWVSAIPTIFGHNFCANFANLFVLGRLPRLMLKSMITTRLKRHFKCMEPVDDRRE